MMNEKRLTRTFLDLVKIDSHTFNEKGVADYILARFQGKKAEVFVDSSGTKIGGNVGNIIAKIPSPYSSASFPSLLFNAHIDTVAPGKNIKPYLDQGVIRSSTDTILGADDKAGVAAILELIEVIDENRLSCCPIEVTFTVGEEKGLLGSKNLDFSQIKSKMGYVLDSDGPVERIVTQAPSQNWVKATFKGRSAHAGLAPEKGINAIQAASIAVAKMALGRIDRETTANVGVIKGGIAPNIVPAEAQINGEVRSLSQERLEEETARMTNCINEASKEVGAKVKTEVSRAYDAFSLSSDEEVVKIACKALEELGIKPMLVSTGGGSDANIFNKQGIRTVSLGVGVANAHTTEEYLRVDDLKKAAQFSLKVVELVSRTNTGKKSYDKFQKS